MQSLDGTAATSRPATAAGGSRAVPFSMREPTEEDKKPRYDVGHVEQLRPTTSSGGGGGRPRTTGARAGTASSGGGGARAETAGGGGDSGRYSIVVLTENRARQVGVAVCNLAAMHTIELLQVADNQSFSQTLALLHALMPVEIVLPKSQSERLLSQKIVAYWGSDDNPLHTQVSAINRR